MHHAKSWLIFNAAWSSMVLPSAQQWPHSPVASSIGSKLQQALLRHDALSCIRQQQQPLMPVASLAANCSMHDAVSIHLQQPRPSSPVASFDGSKLQQALLRRDSPSLAHNANIKCVCAAVDVEVERANEVARAGLALGVTTFAADVTEETRVAVVAVAYGACGIGGSHPSRAHCTQRQRQCTHNVLKR